MAFFYVKHWGSTRHHGLAFLVLLACYWIEASDHARKTGALLPARRWHDIFLTLALIGMLISGYVSCRRDLAGSVSQGQNVARWLKRGQLLERPLVGYPDYPMASVLGLLSEPMYLLNEERMGTYTVWNRQRKRALEHEDVVRLAGQHAPDYVLILFRPIPHGKHKGLGVRELARFTGMGENYFVYESTLVAD